MCFRFVYHSIVIRSKGYANPLVQTKIESTAAISTRLLVFFLVPILYTNPISAAPFSIAEIADRNVSTSGEYTQSAPKYSVATIEGENVDLRTLAVTWEQEDLRIPGPAGFDLVVSRSHRKISNSPMHLGDWHLGVPRITVPISPYRSNIDPIYYASSERYEIAKLNVATRLVNSTISICSVAGGLTEGVTLSTGGQFLPIFQAAPIILSLPQEGAKVLADKLDAATNFPSSARYATTDNWYAECLSPSESYGDWGGFRVVAPNGTKYTFDRVAYVIPGDPGRGLGAGSVELQVTRVEDVHGNWFEYKYDDDQATSCGATTSCTELLYEIEASDGRKVFFDYISGSTNREADRWETYALISSIRYLSDVATNTEQQISYSYCLLSPWKNSNICDANVVLENPSTHVTDGTKQFLNVVLLPDGSKWQ